MNWRGSITVALLLAIVAAGLCGYVLHSQSGIFREFEAALLSLQWMLLVCLAVWCGSFVFLTFSLNDLPLIALLLSAIVMYFIGYNAASSRAADAIILLAGVTLGRGARVLLRLKAKGEMNEEGCRKAFRNSEFRIFLVGLVLLLAFASWWHLDVSNNFYPAGVRWTGLWDNPNIYGMLMGVGLLLAIGLPAQRQNEKLRMKKFLLVALHVSTGMMAVGLVFSYSRGAWVGTAIGLLYLAKAHGKFKWRWALPPVLVALVVICFFWNNTLDSAPWYLKRLDLSRASAQHRVAAWKAGFEIMRDHPFGVGWNKAIETYDKNYSPPEGGAMAITTNDYLMLGTQLGFPGLLCFVTYVGLCFRVGRASRLSLTLNERFKAPSSLPLVLSSSDERFFLDGDRRDTCPTSLRAACRAGALAMLAAFWFDGGLFKLATAAVFWILLELGTSNLASNKNDKQPTPP